MGIRVAPKRVVKVLKVRARNRGTSQGEICEPGSITYRRIHVAPGEDVKQKILTFVTAAGRPMTVILSGDGSLTGANLKVHNSTEPLRFEGPFVIRTLSGIFTQYDHSDGPSGGLCIMFSGPNGHGIGGAVDGALIAASHVEICVAVMFPVPYPEYPDAEEADEEEMDEEASEDHEDRLSSNAATA